MLSGDFNYDPGRPDWANDDTFRILRSAGFDWAGEVLPRGETVTWLSDGRYPDAAFDHFMVRAGEGVEVSPASTTKTGREVTDHRALTVTVVWVERGSPRVHFHEPVARLEPLARAQLFGNPVPGVC